MSKLARLDAILLRVLIGIYVAVGVVDVGLLVETIFWRVSLAINHPDAHAPDFFILILFGMIITTIPLVIAFGLWRRLKLVRLLLIVCSIWTLGVCAFAVGAVAAGHFGWVNARELGFREPPLHTLAIALGSSAFAGFQWWTLARRGIRASFEAGFDWRMKPTTEINRDHDFGTSDDRIQSSDSRG